MKLSREARRRGPSTRSPASFAIGRGEKIRRRHVSRGQPRTWPSAARRARRRRRPLRSRGVLRCWSPGGGGPLHGWGRRFAPGGSASIRVNLPAGRGPWRSGARAADGAPARPSTVVAPASLPPPLSEMTPSAPRDGLFRRAGGRRQRARVHETRQLGADARFHVRNAPADHSFSLGQGIRKS